MSTATTEGRIEKAARLAPETRQALHDLILVLADSKRVLGLRYSDRMLGAPTLEAGIAASSLAQDEWGHARLTYALLGDFGAEPRALEHERSAGEYRNHPALDRPFGSWSDVIAAGLLVDTAITLQYGALIGSRYGPAHNRVQKMLDEERFHFQYAAGWLRRVAAVPELRDELVQSLRSYLGETLRWLGDAEDAGTRRLVEEGLVTAGPDELRDALLRRVGPVLQDSGLAVELGVAFQGGDHWTVAERPDCAGWDASRRRAGGALDEETAARARGDRNRGLLMD